MRSPARYSAHVGSSIAPLTTWSFLLILMIIGAAWFYLGIDTPPHRFLGVDAGLPQGWSPGKIDTTELLSAVGTFLVTLGAFVSVVLIVFGKEARVGWSMTIMTGWTVGVLMQITAGAMARIRT